MGCSWRLRSVELLWLWALCQLSCCDFGPYVSYNLLWLWALCQLSCCDFGPYVSYNLLWLWALCQLSCCDFGPYVSWAVVTLGISYVSWAVATLGPMSVIICCDFGPYVSWAVVTMFWQSYVEQWIVCRTLNRHHMGSGPPRGTDHFASHPQGSTSG